MLTCQQFFLFLGLKSLSRCSLHSKPLHGLVRISFSMMPGNKCCHGNTFFVSSTFYIFMSSLFSITLHRLELISFRQHLATSVFMFLGLKNLSRVSLHSKPLHRFQMISFRQHLTTSVAMATVFLVSRS